MADFRVQPLNLSWLGELPDVAAKARERARDEQLNQILQGGLPRGPGGTIDWAAAADQAARAGNLGGVETFSRLGQAAAAQSRAAAAQTETARHNRAVEGAYNKPTVTWDPPNPLDPSAPRTGTAIITDKAGNVRTERITMPRTGGQPQPQPDALPQEDPWSAPQGRIPGPAPPSPVGPGAALPGGPAMAQAEPPMSESNRILAEAQGLVPPQPRGPQFAEAPAQTVSDAQPYQIAQATPPRPPGAPAAVPDWLAGAAAPVAGRTPAAPPPTLGPEQRGELRYTAPLGPFNEGAIAHLPNEIQNKIRAIATGRMNIKSTPLTGASRDALTNAVYSYYPGWDETMFQRRQQTLNAFAKGPPANVLRAVNNLTDHLETAENLMKALQNPKTPGFAAILNKWRALTGHDAELPGNVHAAAPIIAGEIMKVVAGVGAGGVGERQETALNVLRTSQNLPTALGALGTVKKLMVGQIRGLELQYENNTYNTDFRQRLSTGARRIYEEEDAAHAPGGGGAPASGGRGGFEILKVTPGR